MTVLIDIELELITRGTIRFPTAVVRDDPPAVAEAERRYARRYRIPRPNPRRVVIEITVVTVLGPT